MKERIIIYLVTAMLRSLQPKDVKNIADKALQAIEDLVQSSDNDIDDKIVLPVIDLIRRAFELPV